MRVSGRPADMELHFPEGPGPWPAVLVFHEMFGLNADIRRIAKRFAANGYLAAAPDLARGRHWSCLVSAILQMQRGKGPAVDLAVAAVDLLKAREDVARIGAVGFCMGGGFALLLGTLGHLDATADFYGQVRPRGELSRCCPVTGGFGGKDLVYARQGRQLMRDLEELGIPCDLKVYDACGHSFMNQSEHPYLERLSWPVIGGGYHEPSAEDSWERMLAFFGRHLREPAASG